MYRELQRDLLLRSQAKHSSNVEIMKNMIAAVLAFALSIPVQAGYFTGNNLRESILALERFQAGRSTGNDANEVIKVSGYLMGVADSWNGLSFCATSGVTVVQIASITKKYLDSVPERWDQPGAYLIVDALAKAFPCSASK